MADPITLGVVGATVGSAIGAGTAHTALGFALGGAAGAALGFGAKKLLKGSGGGSGQPTFSPISAPQVSDDSGADKVRKTTRAALIKSDQESEDILGGPSIGRNELVAI